ncbi:MAG: RIP metalloprotease RseP [Candidatus Latescibacteria bacterium]|nr:RIP metalloprotease RseP [Candidatus Latescibacterota bacterium]
MLSTILYFILALGILVFVHELGHFLVAKKAGIRVERFSLGFPPKMIGVQVGETEYCLSWIPLGGYVKVAGMADVGNEETTGEPWEYPSKSVGVRMAVIAAGPFMNFVFAFVALLGLFLAFGQDTIDSTAVTAAPESVAAVAGVEYGDRIVRIDGQAVRYMHEVFERLEDSDARGVQLDIERDGQTVGLEVPAAGGQGYGLQPLHPTLVGSVEPNRPAAAAGLQLGDRIVEVAGQPVLSWDQMSTEIRRYPARSITLAWERDGRRMETEITPEAYPAGTDTVGLIGIGVHYARADVGFGEAIIRAGQGVVRFSLVILDVLGGLFADERYKELGGPLLIAQMAGQTAERGMDQYLSFLAMLSVNLAILNLLPIPVLDGGHLVFLILEAVRRRPLAGRGREVVQQIGLLIMLSIMVLVFYNDLNRMLFPYISSLFE